MRSAILLVDLVLPYGVPLRAQTTFPVSASDDSDLRNQWGPRWWISGTGSSAERSPPSPVRWKAALERCSGCRCQRNGEKGHAHH